MKLNGARIWKLENSSPRTFSRVKVWAAEARHAFPPADAYIKNLLYENIGICIVSIIYYSCKDLKFTERGITNKIIIIDGSPTVHSNMVYTQPTWGPTYIVSLKLYINSFDGPNLKNGKQAELIRLTTTNGNCCGIGDRIPAIFTDKRGFIQVGTQIGNHGNKWKNVNLNAKTWYNLELMQYGLNNKVIG